MFENNKLFFRQKPIFFGIYKVTERDLIVHDSRGPARQLFCCFLIVFRFLRNFWFICHNLTYNRTIKKRISDHVSFYEIKISHLKWKVMSITKSTSSLGNNCRLMVFCYASSLVICHFLKSFSFVSSIHFISYNFWAKCMNFRLVRETPTLRSPTSTRACAF